MTILPSSDHRSDTLTDAPRGGAAPTVGGTGTGAPETPQAPQNLSLHNLDPHNPDSQDLSVDLLTAVGAHPQVRARGLSADALRALVAALGNAWRAPYMGQRMDANGRLIAAQSTLDDAQRICGALSAARTTTRTRAHDMGALLQEAEQVAAQKRAGARERMDANLTAVRQAEQDANEAALRAAQAHAERVALEEQERIALTAEVERLDTYVADARGRAQQAGDALVQMEGKCDRAEQRVAELTSAIADATAALARIAGEETDALAALVVRAHDRHVALVQARADHARRLHEQQLLAREAAEQAAALQREAERLAALDPHMDVLLLNEDASIAAAPGEAENTGVMNTPLDIPMDIPVASETAGSGTAFNAPTTNAPTITDGGADAPINETATAASEQTVDGGAVTGSGSTPTAVEVDEAVAAAPTAPVVEPAPMVGEEFVARGGSAVSVQRFKGRVRNGQVVENLAGNVVIEGAVHPGGVVLAGGDIHVYGTAAGKLQAGHEGNEKACIYVQSLEAEMVSIGSYYYMFEEIKDTWKNRPLRISLTENKRIHLEPITAMPAQTGAHDQAA